MRGEIFDYLKLRLSEWAYYYTKGESNGLGFASKNTIALWREGWSITSDDFGPRPLLLSDAAEEIEAHVVAMSKVYPEAAKVLRSEYLDPRERIVKARRLHFSISRYRDHLEVAYAWLVGVMGLGER